MISQKSHRRTRQAEDFLHPAPIARSGAVEKRVYMISMKSL
ncbi:hypothetical protein ASZ90_009084 [hydrocarbon metagenome]|uniref:Uncharacterized protein n=1 Tax=hydrocarbon metagenome TaxID=938273 RepID=A0A0W8FJW8_9ZZZZ